MRSTPTIAVAGLAAAAALLTFRRRGAAGRLVQVSNRLGRQRRMAPAHRIPPLPAALLLGVAVALCLGRIWGVLLGSVVGGGAWWWLTRLPSREEERRRRAVESALPLALDLLAACLAAGAAPADAAAAVAGAVGGPLADDLTGLADRLRAGPVAMPAVASAEYSALTMAARALERGAAAGAPAAGVLSRMATRQRSARRAHAEQAARVAGVWAVLPLAVCFLPGFVLLAVVPVAAGLLSGLHGVV